MNLFSHLCSSDVHQSIAQQLTDVGGIVQRVDLQGRKEGGRG